MEKCPEMSAGERFFHWDNVHTFSARAIKDFLAQKSIQMLEKAPFLPDLAQAAFFLFPKIKNKLAGISIIQESLKPTWEGVARFIEKDYITKGF
jgi:hypothetical protein